MTFETNRPHVVMLVGNDIRVDTRVKKTAASLARMGMQVTLIGYGAHGRREESELAGVRVIRVPIAWRFRDQPEKRPRFAVGYRRQSDALLARMKLARRRTDLAAWAGSTATGGGLAAPILRGFSRSVVVVGGQAIRLADLLVRGSRRAQRQLEARRNEAATPERLPWRRAVPIALDYEDAMIDLIVKLSPDVIHAHDVHTVGVADKAAALLRGRGATVKWIYDAHEYVAGLSLYGSRNAAERAGWLDLEATYAPRADRIVTVSPALATELVTRYALIEPPTVVLNAPWEAKVQPVGGVREQAGLTAGVPLLVYSGVVTEARGVDTAVEALTELPGVHLAVVATRPRGGPARQLVTRAKELGVADRLHLLGPVPPPDVVTHLSTADVGLIPIKRFPSHDLALTNKLFEYIHAGLPVVVSDCPSQQDFVREHAIGASHIAADSTDFARAVREVLDRRAEFKVSVGSAALRARYSWQQSERDLSRLYGSLLDRDVQLAQGLPYPALVETPQQASGRARELIVTGSAADDFAAAASAVSEYIGLDVSIRSTAALAPADLPSRVQDVCGTASHVLVAGVDRVLRPRRSSRFIDDLATIRAEGCGVGVVLGPDGPRSPTAQLLRYSWSACGAGDADDEAQRFEAMSIDLMGFDGPVYVSDPDMVEDIVESRWLPVVLGPAACRERVDVLTQAVPRVVLYSRKPDVTPAWRRSDATLRMLSVAGSIAYDSLIGASDIEIEEAIATADVLVDDLGYDGYSARAATAMAAGILVLAHLSVTVRAVINTTVPVMSTDPADLSATLEAVLADRSAARSLAARGPDFVALTHDGRRTAEALETLVGLGASTPAMRA